MIVNTSGTWDHEKEQGLQGTYVSSYQRADIIHTKCQTHTVGPVLIARI